MPDATPPLVTVLMPVRNGAAHLRAAIESIFAQTFSDFELLVIDDGSTDETAAMLCAFGDPRLRVITHPENLGLVPTLNEGLELARGEFVARQDHDDISHRERLQKQVDYLRANPDCALVGSQAWQIGEDGRPPLPLFRPRHAEGIRWYLCFDNAFIHSAVMFRRKVAQESGGYPASLHSEDYALWSRIARGHAIANLPDALLQYRESASSVTGSLGASAAAFDAATAAIRAENLRALFPDDDAQAAEDARVLSDYRRPFSAASAEEFLRVFDRRSASFRRTAQDGRGFREVCAVQLSELAYRLLPVDRAVASRCYRRALREHPPLAKKLPWARLLALFVFGENARGLYQRWIGKR